MRGILEHLYGEKSSAVLEHIEQSINRVSGDLGGERKGEGGSEALLIAYGDHIKRKGEKPLKTMDQFLESYDLNIRFSHLHVLPFYPFTSDDGFSVVDYKVVDKSLGGWSDIKTLAEKLKLVFDFPLNHSSASCPWFLSFLKDEPAFRDYYVTAEPSAQLDQVTRPRAHPLLTKFNDKNVWTTFSEDQVDLNFKNPEVLKTIIDIFMFYVENGARVIRLDAIAYLWKEIGTNCIHLPETHMIVKLFREICDRLPVEVLILTETNVPHEENMSYFGDGDEADMIYQFSLPPLILYSLWKGDVGVLGHWLKSLNEAPSYCCFLNFTASHDGVGVRPLEGCVSASEFNAFMENLTKKDVMVSYKKNSDGTKSPYEINCTYYSLVDLLTDSRDAYLLTQAFIMSLKGIPAFYFSSLFAEENDIVGYLDSGIQRRVNRKKFDFNQLEARLQDATPAAETFKWFNLALERKASLEVFNRDAQQTVELLADSLIKIERYEGDKRVWAIFNFGDSAVKYARPEIATGSVVFSQSCQKLNEQLEFSPYSFVWIEV